ncbi:FtsB family cell division protein [Streptomonospora wellingtoniae]|uniref:Septum formation initiator family protein n=1 Tax=Streptomonospora wellingtoniae TaxID=3075544 RepID=A0ABU2KSJ0_9ACTN|nr:septum formation initiator family protein [Streptomonospora sp. DSM 45055]MDT0302252.1 septum formation initiator family protein [Streptomonospora sp. DSM 45055]
MPIGAAPSSKTRSGAAKSPGRGSGSRSSGGRGGAPPGSGSGRTRPAFTSRAAILALVICVIALSLAYPLREYLAQRARIAELREEQAQTEQAVADLQERNKQLKNPAYIEREARTRLHYQYPGERAYVVVSDSDDQDADAAAGSGEPWFTQVWKSVLAADSPEQNGSASDGRPGD